MTKKYIRIAELIYKDKIGELTEREKNELLAWLEESDFNRQIFDELAKGSSLVMMSIGIFIGNKCGV